MDNIQNSIWQEEDNNNTLNFDYNATESGHAIIKVVGVGGGGSNAVRHMFQEGIQDVTFLIINTDYQALKGSPIPNKLQISEKGLGAGAKPEVARDCALQYEDQIRAALEDGTEMVFITAGMGGGTGTGAAPIVARIAHDLGILTVGIVTIPFEFEGRDKIVMALDGVKAIKEHVDALLVVNNNRLIDIYPDFNFFNAFKKADDTLTVAAKSISDIINIEGYMNLDFADVSTTLRDGGVALISTGTANGDNRVTSAIKEAITSPLLQDNDISNAKHLLFELCFSENNPVSMAEISELNDFVKKLNSDIKVIWGAMVDNSLNDSVKIIILASGFEMDDKGAVKPGTHRKLPFADSIGAKPAAETQEPEHKPEATDVHDDNNTPAVATSPAPEAPAQPAPQPEPVNEQPINPVQQTAPVQQNAYTNVQQPMNPMQQQGVPMQQTAYNNVQQPMNTMQQQGAPVQQPVVNPIQQPMNPMQQQGVPMQQTAYNNVQQPMNPMQQQGAPMQQNAYTNVQQQPMNPMMQQQGAPMQQNAYTNVQQQPMNPMMQQQGAPVQQPAYTKIQQQMNPMQQQGAPMQQNAYNNVQQQMNPMQQQGAPVQQPAYTNVQQQPMNTMQQQGAPVQQPVVNPIQQQPVVIEEPKPATSVMDSFENISKYYGEETANKMHLSEARKAYYVLDNDELSNEELVSLIEQLPTYNRSVEELGELKAKFRR